MATSAVRFALPLARTCGSDSRTVNNRALADTIATGNLYAALRIYVSNVKYLKALVAGADRVDINGMPAGKVTAAASATARQASAAESR